MVKNVLPMFQVGKLRPRAVPSQPKSGVSASESSPPHQPPVPAGHLGVVGTEVARRKSTAVVGSAGWTRAGPPQRTGSFAGAGREGDGGSRATPAPWDPSLAPRPTWGHLHWRRGWSVDSGPEHLGGLCQVGLGAGGLGRLPRVGQPPWPRHLEREAQRCLGWGMVAVDRDSPAPGHLRRMKPSPTPGLGA